MPPGPGSHAHARELVDLVAGLAAEQLGQLRLLLGDEVHAEQLGALRDAVGAVLVREADEEARRVDARLGGEADQAAGALAVRARRDDEHRVVEVADERVEGRAGHAFHARITRRSRSKPSVESDAVPSLSLPPPSGPRPIQRPAELAQQVRVGEEQRVAVGRQRALDHAVGARGELLERLAAGAVVAPHVPARALDADLLRGPPLVVAVVALAQVGVGLGAVAEAGELGGAAGALHRRAEHERELAPGEPRRDLARLRLALGQQRQVGGAGVLAGAAPLGLAVADEDDLGSQLRPVAAHVGVGPVAVRLACAGARRARGGRGSRGSRRGR